MRPLIVGIVALPLGTLGFATGSFGQKAPTPRGEVRIVDKNPVGWGWVPNYIFDHLMDIDRNGQLVPQLATGWRWLDGRTLEVTLRRGVQFQNGEAFDAEIVKLNWEENIRQRQPHVIGVHMNFTPGSRLQIVTPYTVRFAFSAPDGAALVKLMNMHLANRQFYHELGWGETRW
jgi:ABC-type transport system substrate-binding protein